MDVQKFIEGVRQQECCGSCRFFRDGGETLETKPLASNAKGSRLASGVCRRFPPVMVRQREGRVDTTDAEWEQPPIKVIVTEYATGGESDKGWIGVSPDRSGGDVPWCGEYKEADNLEYYDGDIEYID